MKFKVICGALRMYGIRGQKKAWRLYIADIKEFFVDNGGYVEQYNNVNGDEHYYEINDCLLSAAALVKEYGNAMEKRLISKCWAYHNHISCWRSMIMLYWQAGN